MAVDAFHLIRPPVDSVQSKTGNRGMIEPAARPIAACVALPANRRKTENLMIRIYRAIIILFMAGKTIR